tara:strand:+ start:3752 stop:4963 length:1212 start_codon:yes stop_codon:yes gene_type:complete
MEKDYLAQDDSIDIIKIFHLIWLGKWKVIGISLIAVLVFFLFQQMQSTEDFIATTKVKPISSSEELEYSRFNLFIENFNSRFATQEESDDDKEEKFISLGSLRNFVINSETLFDLYIEQINYNRLFEDAIIEYKLIRREDFKNNESFSQAVGILASKIKFEEQSTNGSDIYSSGILWEIEFSHYDKSKWKDILLSVHLKAQDNIKKHLSNHFNTAIEIAIQKNSHDIDDAVTKMDNLFLDYETSTIFLLQYLEEQAEIARELDIAKSGVEALFSSRNVMLNVEFEIPFYLKGYEAIEKEIELIKSRKDKRPFIENYSKFENSIREIKQDKTIERAIESFNSTPIVLSENFVAANMQVDATEFEHYSVSSFMYLISAFVGFFLAVSYLIISNAFRERKENSQLF